MTAARTLDRVRGPYLGTEHRRVSRRSDEAHDDFLKRRSAELGVTEAEIVRDALDSYAAYSGSARRDGSAWAAEEAFINELVPVAESPVPIGRTWHTDDLHES